MLFLEKYRVNADLSRFCKGLSVVELVVHRLWHSHDAEHHRQLHLGKQAFLSHSPRFICDIHRVLLKLYLVSIFGQYYGFC